MLAVYGSYANWSSQALERGFELAYGKGGRDEKIKAYTYLRKLLYMLQMIKDKEAPSGALTRVRRRLPMVINALKLTREQVLEIDQEMGIIPKGDP